MSKQRHWFILACWAVVLLAAVVFLWDRFYPGSGAGQAQRPSGNATTSISPASADLQAEPKSPDKGFRRLHEAIKASNPGYNGNGKFLDRDGKVVVADLSATGVSDLSPLSKLPLYALDMKDNPVSDLAPLKGMALLKLALENTKVTDLEPLKGMPLTNLYLNNTPVRDLSPLAGMPLTVLDLYQTPVEDISPLAGMPLKSLWLNGTHVKDITPLRGCPLVSITIEGTPVTDISPLAGSKLERVHIGQSAVTDLTPIGGLPLTRLIFTPRRIKRGMEIARSKSSLREIGTTLDGRMPPGLFWNLYDKGGLEGQP